MLSKIISDVDAFVWGPVMLVLLVGTGVLSNSSVQFPNLEKSSLGIEKDTKQKNPEQKQRRG